jgi:hypothetical protein
LESRRGSAANYGIVVLGANWEGKLKDGPVSKNSIASMSSETSCRS